MHTGGVGGLPVTPLLAFQMVLAWCLLAWWGAGGMFGCERKPWSRAAHARKRQHELTSAGSDAA